MSEELKSRELADFFPYRLSVTSNAVSVLIANRYRARFGLKIPEWRVMAVLGDRGTATQRELTELTLMDKVAVNRACKELEDRALASRQPNARDGRSHLLALTDEGRSVYDEVMPLATQTEREILSVLSDDEQAQLRDLLEKVLSHTNGIRSATP